MDFKKLFKNNDKAVSPVIGVILMVAITVILAAAIGSSVFGQKTVESVPQVDLNIQSAGISTAANSTAKVASVTFEHLGGDPINFATEVTRVTASVNGVNSQELDVTCLNTMSVGDIKKTELKTFTGILVDRSGASPEYIASGDVVNFKVIDVKTNQLICNEDVRF